MLNIALHRIIPLRHKDAREVEVRPTSPPIYEYYYPKNGDLASLKHSPTYPFMNNSTFPQ